MISKMKLSFLKIFFRLMLPWNITRTSYLLGFKASLFTDLFSKIVRTRYHNLVLVKFQ